MGLNRGRIKNHKPIVLDSLDDTKMVDDIKEVIQDDEQQQEEVVMEVKEEIIEDIVEPNEIKNDVNESVESVELVEDVVEEVNEIEDDLHIEEECESASESVVEVKGITLTYDKSKYENIDHEFKDITDDTVICVTKMRIYADNKEGSEDTGANAGSIKKCCNGNAKSAGKDEEGNKLVWMYLRDYIK